MSSPAAQQIAGAPASQPVFPDGILEEIFLRLDAAEDLARAAAACTAFHRVVSARRFLRRFRCLHPTPALGLLEFCGRGAFHPAEPPHRSAPAARAPTRAADLTFSFLDTHDPWEPCDARDGRVLLYWQVKVNLMVCDPLHRRHVLLPPVPNTSWGFQFEAFLDPATDTEEENQDLSFGVVCAANNQQNIVIFHFTSATRKWQGIKFNAAVPLGPYFNFRAFERYYAHGCFFWRRRTDVGSSFMVMLSMHDMKLSVVHLPPGTHEKQHAIVEAGEGMIGLLTFSDGLLQLYSKYLQGTDWHHERIIPLPKLNSHWKIHNAAAGYLLLQAKPRDSSPQYFTVNLKTFLVERLCIPNQYIAAPHLYASFLLPFSQPTI